MRLVSTAALCAGLLAGCAAPVEFNDLIAVRRCK